MTILDFHSNELRVCRFGRDSIFGWHGDGKNLLLEDKALREAHRLLKLKDRPDALTTHGFRLPPPVLLSQEKVRTIQRELSLRMQSDQASLRAPNRPRGLEGSEVKALPWLETRSDRSPKLPPEQADFQFAATAAENTEYIRGLLAEVGWIDVARFGYSTSKAAFLLVQHSWDAALMSAVLPDLKRDVDAGRIEADAYALLFDRLQLSLGRRQRFGSQVARDETGALVVLPVEDPATVDSLRAQLGMIPLKEYFQVFGGSEVRFSTACR
jgi:hypothetical protein